MDKPRERWTRRDFLQMVGLAGGSAAVYETMVALGMLRTPEGRESLRGVSKVRLSARA